MKNNTAVTRLLKQRGFDFNVHSFTWEKGGGTAHSSSLLGVQEHAIIKTLIMEDDQQRPLCILMHGDCKVNTKALAKFCEVRKIRPCAIEQAEKLTGYKVGGTSPFAMRKTMPLYVEQSIFDLPKIYK